VNVWLREGKDTLDGLKRVELAEAMLQRGENNLIAAVPEMALLKENASLLLLFFPLRGLTYGLRESD